MSHAHENHEGGDVSGGAHAGDHGGDHMPLYNRTIITLSVLTALEFGIAYFLDKGLGMTAGILLLVGLAGVKAFLVAKFFMHLKFDPKALGYVIATPLFLATPLILITGYDVVHGPAW